MKIISLLVAFVVTFLNISPVFAANCSDTDGDGWGWDGTTSCRVSGVGPCVDKPPYNDPYGWNGVASCRLDGRPIIQNSSGDGRCVDTPPYNDPYGWDGSRPCRLDGAPITGSASEQSPSSAYVVSYDAKYKKNYCADPEFDGHGYDNVTEENCRIASGQGLNVGHYEHNPRISETYGNHNVYTGSCKPTGNGWCYNPVTRKSERLGADWRNSPFNLRNCYHEDELFSTKFALQNNQWGMGTMWSDNYFLCTELIGNSSNPKARWQYDFLAMDKGRAGEVKAYPQVYYGLKHGATHSATRGETGLPVKVNQMGNYKVKFKFSEKGYGERNVALESFFHTGGCSDDKNHPGYNTRDNRYKHIEMMVWVGRPFVRKPGNKHLGEVQIDGRKWHMWTNSILPWGYIAYASEDTITEATLDWKAFVNHTKQWLDKAENRAKDRTLVRLTDDMCMPAIEMGTEIFWGKGEFTLEEFKVYK